MLLGDEAREHLRIAVCESADGRTLLIHGEPATERDTQEECHVARRCFLTAMPSPAAHCETNKRLCATHMSYVSTCATPFAPLISGIIHRTTPSPPRPEGGPAEAESGFAVLNTG